MGTIIKPMAPLSLVFARIHLFWNTFWLNSGYEKSIWPVRFCLYFMGTIFVFIFYDQNPEGFFSVWQPISFYKLLDGPLSLSTLEILRFIWITSGVLAGLSILFAWTSSVCFLSALVLLGHSYNFGYVYHSTHMYVVCLGIMSLSRSNQTWPFQMMKTWIVYVMLYTGIQKLYYGDGFLWAFSESFYLRLLTNPERPPLNLWLLSKPIFYSQLVAGFSLIVVELSAPLTLIYRRLGIVYFIIWTLFHFGVTASFGGHTLFYSQIFCYSAFLPWSWVSKLVNRLTR